MSYQPNALFNEIATNLFMGGTDDMDVIHFPAKNNNRTDLPFDAIVTMYHDQGLPVLKYSGFEQAVNLTLGLPYPRVAVDHGTALDLAGRGLADPSSLRHAIALCAALGARRLPA